MVFIELLSAAEFSVVHLLHFVIEVKPMVSYGHMFSPPLAPAMSIFFEF